MKNLIFTLCSNNYLAHAKTLGDSVLRYAPETEFVIGLVDKRDPSIDYSVYSSFRIIGFDEIGILCFEEMLAVYNVIEFNTAVKPYYFEYLLNEYGHSTNIFYIDPDIVLYAGIDSLTDLLQINSIALTPNLTTISSVVTIGELASLRHGMYNLGFIGIRYTEESFRFIKWWQERLRTHCIIDKPKGLFVDQKWVDIAPLFFKDILISGNKGLNMAWWNLSERKLVHVEGKYYVNNLEQELIFYHFSGYTPGSPFYTGRVNHFDFSFEAHPELKPLYADYETRLIENQYAFLSKQVPLLSFGYAKKKIKSGFKESLKKRLKPLIKKLS